MLISVYVVTYNRALKLKRCLDSILNQSLKDFEIVVVDNGSTDDTAELLNVYSERHQNLKFFLLGENKGACHARNVGILSSTGKYITGVDDDDEWLPNRLEILYAAYSEEYSCVFDGDTFVFPDRNTKINVKKREVSVDSLKYQNYIGNQVFTERCKLIDAGLFDVSLVAAQDYDMWYRLVKAYGPAKNAGSFSQLIHLDGADRITASKKKKYGYFRFYKKHRDDLSLQQKKFQLLNIKYVCQSSISLRVFLTLCTITQMKRMVAIFFRKVIFSSAFKF